MATECGFCGNEASLKCSGCKNIVYCNAEHQKKHWKTHKPDCRPFTIQETDDVGRCAIATRDIPANSIIFQEQPLVVGPKWCLEENEKDLPVMPCVGCFNPIQLGEHTCDGCSWPICSSNCPGLDVFGFHQLECPILSRGEPAACTDLKMMLNYYRSDALLTLRCLLLFNKYPQKWKQLQALQSHDVERIGTKYYKEADNRIVKYLKSVFLDRIKAMESQMPSPILPDCNDEDIHRICGIIEVNALNISLPNGQEISALYPTACLLEHSCIPNCSYTFDFDKRFRIRMRAGRDIRKGEHLSIMYTHMLWGTQMRQEHLLTNKYFTCRCARCTDPTELGTYLSALKCIGIEMQTCGGTLLPDDPISPETEWGCDRCPARIANDEVQFLLSNIEVDVDGVMMKSSATVKELEQLIDKLQQLLHPNHYHLFALKHSLIQLYGNQTGYLPAQMSTELYDHKIKMCKQLLEIIDVIDPFTIRLQLYTAIICYEMHSALVQRNQRLLDSDTAKITAEMSLEFKEAEAYLMRAKRVLDSSSDIPQSRKFLDTINKGVENLADLFTKLKI